MRVRRLAALPVLVSAFLATSTIVAMAAPLTRAPISAIEGLASYAPQSTCSPTAKPGVLAFSKLVLAAYPGTGSSGIVRDCSVGGRSEHKEGRAWDWTVSYANSRQRAQAQDLINWLFATDAFSHRYTNARRLGVMYVIWNHRIWGSYAASAGWRAYSGTDPHTTHMHISFSWAGANKRTSYWTGVPAAGERTPVGPVLPSRAPTAGPAIPGTGWHPVENENGDVNRDSDRRMHRRRGGHRVTPVPLPTAWHWRWVAPTSAPRATPPPPSSSAAPRPPASASPAPSGPRSS